jgi:hypothetical protein
MGEPVAEVVNVADRLAIMGFDEDLQSPAHRVVDVV